MLPRTGPRAQVALPLGTPGKPGQALPHVPAPPGRDRVDARAARLQPFVSERALCPRSAFDLVNIHLFHDASNLVAWETSPSVYAGIRHKALGYVLDR